MQRMFVPQSMQALGVRLSSSKKTKEPELKELQHESPFDEGKGDYELTDLPAIARMNMEFCAEEMKTMKIVLTNQQYLDVHA